MWLDSCAKLQCICSSRVVLKASWRGFVTTANVRSESSAGGKISQRHSTVKRKVAIHFGYVGTGFRGLQFLRDPEKGDAVEDVLEKAILNSGGILPTNAGNNYRTGWSRSSRTDKGVHSLSTVVGVNLECEDGVFERDPEGQTLAAAINQRLPEQIRVFSVQRTHSSFDARRQCQDRTYHYHVPATVLGLSGGCQDAAVLDRLADCLDHFKGSHPFHNFTDRKRYRLKQQQKLKSKALKLWQVHHRGVEGQRACSTLTAGESGDLESSQEAFKAKLRWLPEPVEGDSICQAHYRLLKAAEAGPPRPLMEGGKPCVTILLRGSSFMVYQIRHMVAAAVGVATQRLPLQLVEAALCKQTRIDLPLAPPQALLLADSCFYDFPAAHGQPHPVTALSGPALTLRARGCQQKAAFCRQTLSPALDAELGSPTWSAWAAELDSGTRYDPKELESLLEAHSRWKAGRSQEMLCKADPAA